MRVAVVEVKPKQKDYVAKEMAGGLGKRLKLKETFWGSILNRYLTSSFNAPPVILAQIAAIFTQHNHQVDAYYTHETKDIAPHTDIIVILSSMVDYRNEVNFVKKLKEIFPDKKIIICGSFGSAMPEIYESVADHIIMGDPEEAMEAFSRGDIIKEKRVQSKSPEDLSRLPMIEWTPFLKNGYYALRPFSKEKGVSIQKSRGCTMTCNYCPYAAFYGPVKEFSSSYVINTIKHYYQNYNIRYFMFRDPNFGERKKEFYPFMEDLINMKLPISFSCEARLDTFNDEDLKLMYKAGLRYMITGVESSNDAILKENMRRAYKKEDAFRKIALLEKLGAVVQTNFIFGFSHETQESVLDTIEYAKVLNSMFATFHIFTPQPGTRIFDDYKDRFLNVDWQDFSYSHLVWRHDQLSKEFLEGALYKAYVEYYFRPQWITKHFKTLLKIII